MSGTTGNCTGRILKKHEHGLFCTFGTPLSIFMSNLPPEETSWQKYDAI